MDLERVLAIIRSCQIEETGTMTPQAAAVAMKQIILGAVRGFMETEPLQKPLVFQPAAKDVSEIPYFGTQPSIPAYGPKAPGGCRRSGHSVDVNGSPFPHIYDPNLKSCIFCGDGAAEPPPEAYEKKPTGLRTETVACTEHGSHPLSVRPDGTYDKPDCEMFGQRS